MDKKQTLPKIQKITSIVGALLLAVAAFITIIMLALVGTLSDEQYIKITYSVFGASDNTFAISSLFLIGISGWSEYENFNGVINTNSSEYHASNSQSFAAILVFIFALLAVLMLLTSTILSIVSNKFNKTSIFNSVTTVIAIIFFAILCSGLWNSGKDVAIYTLNDYSSEQKDMHMVGFYSYGNSFKTDFAGNISGDIIPKWSLSTSGIVMIVVSVLAMGSAILPILGNKKSK